MKTATHAAIAALVVAVIVTVVAPLATAEEIRQFDPSPTVIEVKEQTTDTLPTAALIGFVVASMVSGVGWMWYHLRRRKT